MLTGTDSLLIKRAGVIYQTTLAAILSLLSAPVINSVTVDLGTPAKRSGKFTIAGTGLIVGKPVHVWTAIGPYPGKGYSNPDESQLYEISCTGIVTAANLITVFWSSRHLVRGNVVFNYEIGG